MVVINCLWRMEDFCCVTIKSLSDSPVRLFHILIHSPHWLLIDSQFSIVSLLNFQVITEPLFIPPENHVISPPPPKKKTSDCTPSPNDTIKITGPPKHRGGCIGVNRYHGWLSIRHLTRQNYVQYSDCRLFKLVIRD